MYEIVGELTADEGGHVAELIVCNQSCTKE